MAPGGNIASAAEPAKAAAAPVAVTDADPALWVVKDEDTTIYLFGTVHVLKPGLGWFDEAVKTAFDASDQLMLELVMPEDQAEVAKVMRSEEHTYELQSLMRISYAVFCLTQTNKKYET